MIFEFKISKNEIEYFSKFIESTFDKALDKYYFHFSIQEKTIKTFYTLMLIKKNSLWNIHYFNEEEHFEIETNLNKNKIINMLNEIWSDKFKKKSEGTWLKQYKSIKHKKAKEFYYNNSPFDSNGSIYDFFNKAGLTELSITVDEENIEMKEPQKPNNIKNIKKGKIVLSNIKNRI
jgi:hypothetical protein